MKSNDDSSSDNKLYGKIGKLIKIIDDLRDLGLNEVFELPKICVLGTQSSGKSSVLESIIGLDCLPRGSGLVTRRPLELRLVHIHYNDNSEPWAEFEEIKGKKFTNFEEVKRTIEKLTDDIAGNKGNIVNIPIKLNIYSKTCPDLTVIDLPGITRIPLSGSDQPENIEEVTKGMCELYCQDKTTIILCVLQANVDISTSEALHMARRLDPTGDRTIGVLTKLDIMDSGTDAKKILTNSEISLKHGYIAVKNRSQQDLIDKIQISIASQKELMFFKTHTVYSKMSSSYFGIENLIEKLRKIFYEHLKLFLPDIYQSLKNKIQECKKCLEELGSNDFQLLSSGNEFSFLNDLINRFCHNVEISFNGKSQDLEENKTSHKLKIMYYEFLEKVQKKPSENLHNSYISEIIVRSEGDRLSGFPESTVFQEILSLDFDIIKEEVQVFYDEIYSISVKAILNIMDKYFKFFPQLKTKMEDLVMEFINKSFNDSKYISESICKMNMEYLYIDDNENFRKILNGIIKELSINDEDEEEDLKGKKLTEEEMKKKKEREAKREEKKRKLLNRSSSDIANEYNIRISEYVKKIIDYYYELIIRNLRESIPKTFGNYYVKNMKNMRSSLLVNVFLNKNEDLFSEDPNIAMKRKYHYDILKILEKSEKLMLSDSE